MKFNARSHQNRSYRRTTTPLDSDDDSDSSFPWSPRENQETGEAAESNEVEAESTEETNNNEEHEIMSGVIEFGVSFVYFF